EPTARDPFRIRATLVDEPSSFPKHRLFVNRPKEMSTVNTFALQACHGLGSIERNCVIKNNTKYPVGILCVLRSLGRYLQARMSAKTLLIPTTDLTLLRNYLVNTLELSHADCRLNIAHAEVPAELFVYKTTLLVETQVAQVSTAIR